MSSPLSSDLRGREPGGDLTRVHGAPVPADRAGLPDTEALGRLPPRGSRFDRFNDTLAQIDRQSWRHGALLQKRAIESECARHRYPRLNPKGNGSNAVMGTQVASARFHDARRSEPQHAAKKMAEPTEQACDLYNITRKGLAHPATGGLLIIADLHPAP